MAVVDKADKEVVVLVGVPLVVTGMISKAVAWHLEMASAARRPTVSRKGCQDATEAVED
jgi:hypothetical protein